MANTDGVTSDIGKYPGSTYQNKVIKLYVSDFESLGYLMEYASSLGDIREYQYDIREDSVTVQYAVPVTNTDIRDMSVTEYAKLRSALGYDTNYRGIFDNPYRITSNHSYLPKNASFILGSGFMSAPINVPAEPAVKETSKLDKPVLKYEDYYWKYVNSKDNMTAAEAFANMIDLVKENQEPNHDMSSWVEEPETTEIVKPDKMPRPVLAFMVLSLGFMITAIILHLGFGVTL